MRALRLLSVLALTAAAAPSLAQSTPPPAKANGQDAPAGDRPVAAEKREAAKTAAAMEPLTIEQVIAAWERQADGVAKSLALDHDLTLKLVAAYIDARQQLRDATFELRLELLEKMQSLQDPDGGVEVRERAADLAKELRSSMTEMFLDARDKFEMVLQAFLRSDQVEEVMATLGTFEPTWDLMVHTISEFKLESAKADEAILHVQEYVKQVASARRGVTPEMAHPAIVNARNVLLESMRNLLSDEQLTTFKQALAGVPLQRQLAPTSAGLKAKPADAPAAAGASADKPDKAGH